MKQAHRSYLCSLTTLVLLLSTGSKTVVAFQFGERPQLMKRIAAATAPPAQILTRGRCGLQALRPRQEDPLSESNEAEIPNQPMLGDEDASNKKDKSTENNPGSTAATNTINERLMVELQEARDLEKKGARSAVGKKLGLDAFRTERSEEDRQLAIEDARDLNGVNPLVAFGGGAFALASAAGLWALTNFLGEFFAMHPIESDVYFVERVTAVFRNVVMGLSSLASGFFGVTGLGILLLGIRVAYGVTTGELDPTPIKTSRKEKVEMPNVWDLMMNKKPGRRGGKGESDNNPFGL